MFAHPVPSASPSPSPARARTPSLLSATRRLFDRTAARLRSTDHHCFDDRRQGARTLVCIIAGYQPELWHASLSSFAAALHDVDVCVVTPGLAVDELRAQCTSRGWSYLGTATNDPSLAQNLCYRLHPDARMIVKVDEDIFLLPQTIVNLVRRYDAIRASGVNPGYLAPIIPINGFGCRPLLEMLDLLEEFEERFGKAGTVHSSEPIHDDPLAARWVWERTAPLAETARKLSSVPVRDLPCSVRLNLGIVVFERTFWEEIGQLPVRRRRLVMGLSNTDADEEHICTQAVAASRPGIVTTAALAGHFGFPAQHDAMLSLLESKPHLFSTHAE
jgi:hypothetical protein